VQDGLRISRLHDLTLAVFLKVRSVNLLLPYVCVCNLGGAL
jgi:hypothetical protein